MSLRPKPQNSWRGGGGFRGGSCAIPLLGGLESFRSKERRINSSNQIATWPGALSADTKTLMNCRRCLDHVQQELLLLRGGPLALQGPVFFIYSKIDVFMRRIRFLCAAKQLGPLSQVGCATLVEVPREQRGTWTKALPLSEARSRPPEAPLDVTTRT